MYKAHSYKHEKPNPGQLPTAGSHSSQCIIGKIPWHHSHRWFTLGHPHPEHMWQSKPNHQFSQEKPQYRKCLHQTAGLFFPCPSAGGICQHRLGSIHTGQHTEARKWSNGERQDTLQEGTETPPVLATCCRAWAGEASRPGGKMHVSAWCLKLTGS